MPDTLTKPEAVPDEYPARSTVTKRRIVRWIAIIAIGVVVVLAIWQDPLYALPDV